VSSSLRILHCIRAPVGGLFRHVHDLALGEAGLGAEVGVVLDSSTGGEEIAVQLGRLADNCALGLTRMPMPRQLGFGDWRTVGRITKLAAMADVDVLHGHGAKGGAYARLAGRRLKRKGQRVKVIYTPHGGTLHYSPTTPLGRFYLGTERKLASYTDGFIFESVFAANRYAELVGHPQCPVRIVPNGLYRHEFYEGMLADDAVDFVYVGELLELTGVDILLEALAAIHSTFPGRAIIVGSGPGERKFKRLARKLGLGARVSFAGPLPARTAFARARCVVVPSRLESFPYILLEAAAAHMPLIATNVGGIPEIMGNIEMPLVPGGDVGGLAAQLRAFLTNPQPFIQRAIELQRHVAARFTVENMTYEVVDFYVSELRAARLRADERIV
jgi:glycosyltransferase involved in cell wall biosynthesis